MTCSGPALDALDLLAFLVRTRAIESPTDSSPRAALRVLGAYRTSEVQSGHPLENLILDLAHDERVSVHELARLSEGEAQLLATTLVGARLMRNNGSRISSRAPTVYRSTW